MAEELKLCPFCGQSPELIDGYIEHRCDGAYVAIALLAEKETKNWNEAYCWKRISALEAQVKELQSQIDSDAYDRKEREND